jgi:hypothetical protein
MPDGDSRQQRRPPDAKNLHRSSLVIVDSGWRQIEDSGNFDSRATKTGKANDLAQARRERGNTKLHGRRHFKSVALTYRSHSSIGNGPDPGALASRRSSGAPGIVDPRDLFTGKEDQGKLFAVRLHKR